jgi:hypothetical protein
MRGQAYAGMFALSSPRAPGPERRNIEMSSAQTPISREHACDAWLRMALIQKQCHSSEKQ